MVGFYGIVRRQGLHGMVKSDPLVVIARQTRNVRPAQQVNDLVAPGSEIDEVS